MGTDKQARRRRGIRRLTQRAIPLPIAASIPPASMSAHERADAGREDSTPRAVASQLDLSIASSLSELRLPGEASDEREIGSRDTQVDASLPLVSPPLAAEEALHEGADEARADPELPFLETEAELANAEPAPLSAAGPAAEPLAEESTAAAAQSEAANEDAASPLPTDAEPQVPGDAGSIDLEPAASAAVTTPPPIDERGDGDVATGRLRRPELHADAGGAVAPASQPAAANVEPNGTREATRSESDAPTRPRIELTDEMAFAAGRVTSLELQPLSAEGAPKRGSKFPPSAEPRMISSLTGRRSSIPARSDEEDEAARPAVIVTRAKIISDRPPRQEGSDRPPKSDASERAAKWMTERPERLSLRPDKATDRPSEKLGDAAGDRVAAEKVAAEKIASEGSGAEKIAADRAAADKLAADKFAAEKTAADKLAADKFAAEKAAADKLAADKFAAEKAAAERIAAAERAPTEKGAAERIAAEKLVADKAERLLEKSEPSARAEEPAHAAAAPVTLRPSRRPGGGDGDEFETLDIEDGEVESQPPRDGGSAVDSDVVTSKAPPPPPQFKRAMASAANAAPAPPKAAPPPPPRAAPAPPLAAAAGAGAPIGSLPATSPLQQPTVANGPALSGAPSLASASGSSSASSKKASSQKQPRRRQWYETLFSDDYLRTVVRPTAAQISRQVDFMQASLGVTKGTAVLDVGCGLGQHALEFARRGCLVVALDLALPMITRAAEDAQQEGLRINFLHKDIRDIGFEGTFDAVVCVGTTFGFFDDEQNREVLGRLANALKPGGRLLLEVVNRDHVLSSQPNLQWFEGDGCVVMEESDFNYYSSRLTVKRTMMREDGRQTESEYSIRLYALHELGQMMQQVGFRVKEVSGQQATRGVFFGAESNRIILLAERKTAAPGRGNGHSDVPPPPEG